GSIPPCGWQERAQAETASAPASIRASVCAFSISAQSSSATIDIGIDIRAANVRLTAGTTWCAPTDHACNVAGQLCNPTIQLAANIATMVSSRRCQKWQ